jgi:hypothetical protein
LTFYQNYYAQTKRRTNRYAAGDPGSADHAHLLFGPIHGHAMAKSIERTSQDVLRVDHGSLYPALQRLERRGTARWGTLETTAAPGPTA